MWRKVGPLLVLLSVGLNLAFVGLWAKHAVGSRRSPSPCGLCQDANGDSKVWCPLHRRLGTSVEQWRQIEPRLAAFRQSSQELCGKADERRAELIELFAVPQPDLEAIKLKQDEILVLQGQVQQLVIGQLLAEKQYLTPAQQKQLYELIRERSSCGQHGPMLKGLGLETCK